MDDARRVISHWSQRPERAVIFDFNGTLSDDEPLLLQVFAELFAAHLGWRLTADEYVARLAGLSDREIIERVVAERRPGESSLVETLLRLRQQRYQELVRTESPVRTDAGDLVRRLASAEVPMAVVTGAQRGDVELVLRHNGLSELIPVVVTEEDVAHGKPHPEGFLAGARRLGVHTASVLVFEDSVAGARGARAAGMTVVGVQGGGAAVEDLAAETDAVVPALTPRLLDHLPELSARLQAGVDGDARAVGTEQVEGMLDR